MSRPTLDRLAELETLTPDADCPADARLSLPVADIRDLLALIPVARAAEVLRDSLDHPNQTLLCDAVCEAFEEYDHVRPDAFTAEREAALRAEGLFDMADMYRELRERLLMRVRPVPYDCEIFDRGRTAALLQLIDTFPRDLTFYDEAGQALSTEQAMKLGGWAPKRRASRG